MTLVSLRLEEKLFAKVKKKKYPTKTIKFYYESFGYILTSRLLFFIEKVTQTTKIALKKDTSSLSSKR